MSLSRDQLSLDLRMPWNGYSPRGLTRGGLLVRFEPEGTSWPVQVTVVPQETRVLQDLHQLELFDGA